ncbi:MAG: putative serine/threonine protein phosphatase [Chaenotheca gracillima]|nr:MAG: putative serine/threonine protein phosphatase [Chaenotheca gracillima]
MPPSSGQLPAPLVLTSNSPADFIKYIVEHSNSPTTLVVCSTRDEFLEQLLCVTTRSDSNDTRETTGSLPGHDLELLTPTLSLLTVSTAITVAFCPTLQHVRGYLSTFSSRPIDAQDRRDDPAQTAAGAFTTRRSILALFNPISVHRSTSDFSAQGISRTLAVAVEAAHRCEMRLVLSDYGDDDQDVEDGGTLEQTFQLSEAEAPSRRPTRGIWDEEVPFLSRTVSFRNIGGDADDRSWTGRKVTVRRVVGRWCAFQNET